MNECIFCTIRDHGLNSALYEDETCFVVLDKFPAERGHMLVISKVHSENLLTAPDLTVGHAFTIAKRFAALCTEKLNATGVNVITNIGRDAGQAIPHFHIHIIPKYPAGQHDMHYNGRSEMAPDEIATFSKLLGMRQ